MRPGPGYPRKVSAASPARLISIGYRSRPLRLSRRLNGLYKRDSGGVTSPLKVEQWPIDRPIEYARNSRKNDAKVDQMAAAIREFGFRSWPNRTARLLTGISGLQPSANSA